jgi:hypothetical protein
MGLIPATGWAILWRLWPIALIALGVDVLIGNKSVAGAIASGVLILILVGVAIGIVVFAEQIPFLVELAQPATLQYDEVSHPLDGIGEATISIDWTSAPGYLSSLSDSNNLIEADVAYRGDLVFNVSQSGNRATVTLDSVLQGISYGRLDFDDDDAEWDVRLSPDVVTNLRLDGSSGRGDFDLSRLQVSDLELDVGSGAVELTLPSDSSFEGEIDGGSGALVIRVPENVGLRVELDDGSGSFGPGDRLVITEGERGDDSVWETRDYAAADYKVVLSIDQGSGSLTIEDVE